MQKDLSDKIICALDIPDPLRAAELVKELDGMVNFFKVGMLLQYTGGKEFIHWLIEKDKRVFLDMKYYDIPETVGSVVKEVASSGVNFLTIHGNAKVIEHAVRAKEGTSLKLLAVTVLTSMDVEDFIDLEVGTNIDTEKIVIAKTKSALEKGCDGVIASGKEAKKIKESCSSNFILVTPGIRGLNEPLDEHKRAVSPREAISAGADHLVIGRPITKASDPREASREIFAEIGKELN